MMRFSKYMGVFFLSIFLLSKSFSQKNEMIKIVKDVKAKKINVIPSSQYLDLRNRALGSKSGAMRAHIFSWANFLK